MKIMVMPEVFAICRLNQEQPIPEWALNNPFSSITKTSDELSIICLQNSVPEGVAKNGNWRCLKIEGPLDFSAVGILNSITQPLAKNGISILAVSTYETDYFLVREEQLAKALKILSKEGHKIEQLA
ncbi:MAG: ACT domain-containing protein [Thermodesulfobacteriota bacterium]